MTKIRIEPLEGTQEIHKHIEDALVMDMDSDDSRQNWTTEKMRGGL